MVKRNETKSSAITTDDQDLLSPELREELSCYGNNEVLLITKPKKKKQKLNKGVQITPEIRAEVKKLSKAKQKKLQQLKEKKEKATKREQIFASLEKNQMTAEQLALLHSSGKLGGKATMKDLVKRLYGLHKAGIALTAEEKSILYKETDVVEMVMEDQGDQPEPEEILKTKLPAETTAPELKEIAPNDVLAKLHALRKKNQQKQQALLLAQQQHPTTGSSTTAEQALFAPYVAQPIELDHLLHFESRPSLAHNTEVIQVTRREDIELSRMQLPVCSAEQEVMEAIQNHSIVILCGETGSGKTTQVPQFLYEAGYGNKNSFAHPGLIAVTQPRRVAAISTAKRIAEELNVPFGKHGPVGYHIRYDSDHIGPNTTIKLMTDGILLREVHQDFLLRKYSCIILDEAHERNINTDILIGLLSRVIPLRDEIAREETLAWTLLGSQTDKKKIMPLQPLKLVIMSATLRVRDFTANNRLFPTPPKVLKVDARQYPVTTHFNKRTELEDYVSAAFKKVAKIHRKLPAGGVLVFLTGQDEILTLCRDLRLAFQNKKDRRRDTPRLVRLENEHQRTLKNSSATRDELHEHDDEEMEAEHDDDDTIVQVISDSDSEEELDDQELEAEQREEEDRDQAIPEHTVILPLYSLLSNEDQMKVFASVPENHRLIVVATNVAETSLTIPGIKYVVDAGRSKERVYDPGCGISEFQVQWVSKASADQRAGRAGRTGPGHCYRLYSSAVFDTEFPAFSEPEIITRPIEDVVLQMKGMGIDEILHFPFPTPPASVAIAHALTMLSQLGALDPTSHRITSLGKILSRYPIASRYAKMLILARHHAPPMLEYTIAIVAGLSGQSPFLQQQQQQSSSCLKSTTTTTTTRSSSTEEPDDDVLRLAECKNDTELEIELAKIEAQKREGRWIHPESDVLALLRAAGAYAFAKTTCPNFCSDNRLHEKTMQQMLKLRAQLTRIVNQMFQDLFASSRPVECNRELEPPTPEQEVLLRQIIAAGFLDQVAKRIPKGTIAEGSRIDRTCAYLCSNGAISEPVYIHPHSHVFTPNATRLPEYVVYQQIVRSSKTYMKTVSVVDESWLFPFAHDTTLCTVSSPLEHPPPSYNVELDVMECYVTSRYGAHGWELPPAKTTFDKSTVKNKKHQAQVYRWFGRFLLEGKVFAHLSNLKALYIEKPATMTKKKHDPKIQLLLASLQGQSIQSRGALVKRWQVEPTFLFESVLAWIQRPHRVEAKKILIECRDSVMEQ